MKTITIPEVMNKTKMEHMATVTLFDCNCHLELGAIIQVMKALNCSEETSYKYVTLAQTFGETIIYSGTLDDCEKVASIAGSTGLKIAVTY